jgi:hypothetical protein
MALCGERDINKTGLHNLLNQGKSV